jgi:uncharacterized protein (DUF1697 family)
MREYVALLRAVNLGGATQVRMGDLRTRLSELGFVDVRSLLQSGNLLFKTELARRDKIERLIEDEISRSFGRPAQCFARTPEEWRKVIRGNPYPRQAAEDPGHLMVLLLKSAPPDAAWLALQAAITGRETVRGDGDHGYIVYPDGMGRSRLTLDRIEAALGTRGTTRNWNTANKIDSLLAA